MKRLINHLTVRKAFHERKGRLPRGFLEELETDLQVYLRRINEGNIKLEEATGTISSFVKGSNLRNAIRIALNKDRISEGLVISLSQRVTQKVETELNKCVAEGKAKIFTRPVPGKVIRVFILSKEHKDSFGKGSWIPKEGLMFTKFCMRWQSDEKFREEWIERTKKVFKRWKPA